MRKIILSSFFILFTLKSFSQGWQPAGMGMNGNVLALYAYDSLLFAGGTFTTADGNSANNIAQWNNSNWTQVGKGINGRVNAITSYNGKIYVGGKFDSAGGVPARNIAVWNGSSWSALGKGVNDTVHALEVYNGKLYTGGSFDSAGGKLVNYVAGWDGTSWSNLSSGAWATVYALKNYPYWDLNNSVIDTALMIGTITSAPAYNAIGFPNYIAAWNGTSWNYDTGGPAYEAYYFNRIYAFADFYGTLTTGGPSCDTTVNEGDFPNEISQWLGLWPAVISWGTPGGPEGGPIYAFATFDTVLYIGGQISYVTNINTNDTGYFPINNVVSCIYDTTNGGMDTWDTIGGGVNNTVYALALYKGQLYAGGAFTQYYEGIKNKSKGYTANHIAVYKAQKPAGLNSLLNNQTFKIYPNPLSTSSTVSFNEAGDHYLELDDITGRKLRTMESTDTQYAIDRDGLAQGVYLLKVFDGEMKYESSLKVVVQ